VTGSEEEQREEKEREEKEREEKGRDADERRDEGGGRARGGLAEDIGAVEQSPWLALGTDRVVGHDAPLAAHIALQPGADEIGAFVHLLLLVVVVVAPLMVEVFHAKSLRPGQPRRARPLRCSTVA